MTDREGPDAEYLFRVRFRLDPDGVRVDPAAFDTVLARPADEPGTEGWLFFRDRLWRGAVSDAASTRRWAERRLGVPVERIEFAELRTDPAHLTAFRDAVAANLDEFAADTVDEAVTKYLGSSVHVRDREEGDA
ncbi:MAG: LWR-salt protein [Haloferacaceae archaeon]